MSPQMVLAYALATLIGFSLGALGSGGSIITLPVLVYIAGVDPKAAVGMSMAIVGATSAAAAFLQWRRGHFHRKAALLLGASGMAGAWIGSDFTHVVSSEVLMRIFAGLMLVVGAIMFRSRSDELSPGKCRPLRCLAMGAGVGVLTGFLGVGGGFLIVPALVLLAGLETKEAVGTSLAIIAANSAAGLAGQIRHGAIDLPLTAVFTALALMGMVAGLSTAGKLSDAMLRKAFASMLLVVGAVIGAMNL